jgi:hypothetical protein
MGGNYDVGSYQTEMDTDEVAIKLVASCASYIRAAAIFYRRFNYKVHQSVV